MGTTTRTERGWRVLAGWLLAAAACLCLILPAAATEELLSASVRRALAKAAEKKCPLLTMSAPYTMEVSFHTPAQTDEAGLVPGSERIAGRALVFHTEDVFELRRWFCSVMDVCASLPC